jgi:hypothetical protein
MASPTLSRFHHNLRRVMRPREGHASDAHLLELFIEQHDASAFESLMHRHGAMVLAVCRRVLGNADDVEDAFQVTFLVLIRKARSLRARDSVGP